MKKKNHKQKTALVNVNPAAIYKNDWDYSEEKNWGQNHIYIISRSMTEIS